MREREKMKFSFLDQYYQGSLSKLYISLLPEFLFSPWKMGRGEWFWKQESYRIRFINETLAQKMNISSLSQWYSVKKKDFIDSGGAGLLKYFNGSLPSLFSSTFPFHHWQPWQFFSTDKRQIWDDHYIHNSYISLLQNKAVMEIPRDWLKCTWRDVEHTGGMSLIHYRYRSSLNILILSLFPEFEWEKWRMSPFLRGFEKDKKVHAEIFNSIKEENETWADTQRKQETERFLPKKVIFKLKGILKYYQNSLSRFMLAHSSDRIPLKGYKYWEKQSQQFLCQFAQQLFPHLSKNEDALLRNEEINNLFQLDIYYPTIATGLEYQGIQHFDDVSRLFQAHPQVKSRDKEKESVCKLLGLTLIEIPFWWNESLVGLKELISKKRPDLVYLATK